ncbi:MAG: protein translocase subunit SecD [Actinobacteria bacterium]|nr:protein translocase subunit SecD [Actinomycetota bacterium]
MTRIRGLVVSLVFVGLLVGGGGALLIGGVRPQLGLDLVGGVAVTLSAPEGTDEAVMERALENIRARVDALGVAEPSLQLLGDRTIEVQIPGLAEGEIVERGDRFCIVGSGADREPCFDTREEAEAQLQEIGQSRLLELIGRTARLEFREVLAVIPPGDPSYETTPVTCPRGEAGPVTDPGASPSPGTEASPTPEPSPEPTGTGPEPSPTASPAPGGPEDCSSAALEQSQVVFMGTEDAADLGLGLPGKIKYRLAPAGGDSGFVGGVERAAAVVDSGTADVCPGPGIAWCVSFDLEPGPTRIFAELTQRLVGTGAIAIVLDREVQSAPNVDSPITGGTGVITGNFSEPEAKDLAVVLRTGALPVELTRESVETVSATLGRESLEKGLQAGIVGLIALALWLAFYYRLLGVVTWMGMAVWGTLAIAIVAVLGRYAGYSLTLAGIAGLVVSLGITADSYIVFYERLKDEVRKGKTLRVAVVPAFRRAWKTIIAGDLVTILAAAVLYVLAISAVRGFALTLGIATALDMFVVYFFKRPLVFLIARNQTLANLRGIGLRSGVAADPVPEVAGGSR